MFDKDDQEISEIIAAGLEEILSGTASLDDVIARNPSIKNILRPELEAALWLITQKEQVQTRPGFIAASKNRLARRIKQEAHQKGSKRALFGFNWPVGLPAMQWTAAILIVIIFFSMTGGVVSAAQESIPGQELYPVKRLSEQVVFDLTVDTVQKVHLSNHLIERRLLEVEALVSRSEFALAVQALADFQVQVKLTVELLEKINDSNASIKLALANELTTGLNDGADRLRVLISISPEEVQVEIAAAHEATVSGVLDMVRASERIKEKYQITTDTPSPNFSLSQTASPSTSPTVTSTPTPIIVVITPVPTGDDAGATNQEPNKIMPPRRDIKPGLTKTARPPNPNKPQKDEK